MAKQDNYPLDRQGGIPWGGGGRGGEGGCGSPASYMGVSENEGYQGSYYLGYYIRVPSLFSETPHTGVL